MTRSLRLTLIVLAFGLIGVQPRPPLTHAQPPIPLVGPLIAVTPARQDQIRIHDIGTGATRVLTFGYGEHHVWDFSPDGCRIAFTRDDSENGLPTLYTADLDGGNVREMVLYDELPPENWGTWEADWSPTGRIAFTMIMDQPFADGTSRRDHYSAYVDGFAPGRVQFYSVTGREFTPQWSPDGAWLAYVAYDERVPGADLFSTAVPTATPAPDEQREDPTLLNEADLWIVSADGAVKYRLTNFSTGSVRSPRWSPDGELIAFIFSPSENDDTFWMIANRTGAIPTQLSFNWTLTLDHVWLPDGSGILASVRNFRDTLENHLWQIPLNSTADQTATRYIDDANFTHTDFPRFSPDGRYLAFRNVYAVAVIDRLTNTWQRFDEDAPGNTPPVWSPADFAGEEACSGG